MINGILILNLVYVICVTFSIFLHQYMYCESLFTGPKINFTFQKKPYPAYIISSKDDRFNFTQTNLNKALPNYFDIKRKYSVLHNDTRISRFGLPQVSSLLLTYIDLWSEIGKTPKRQLEDNDWVFIFEDDVNILVNEIIQQFHTELFNRWNHTDDQHSLRGMTVIYTGEQITYCSGKKLLHLILFRSH